MSLSGVSLGAGDESGVKFGSHWCRSWYEIPYVCIHRPVVKVKVVGVQVR